MVSNWLFKKLILQELFKNKLIRFFSFKRNSKKFLIFYFLFFIFDISKAETNIPSIKNNQIKIEYLESKNELEDYIVDTGDILSIEFTNKPRGLGLLESEYNPENVSYLNPRSDLRNYKLDNGDILSIRFL